MRTRDVSWIRGGNTTQTEQNHPNQSSGRLGYFFRSVRALGVNIVPLVESLQLPCHSISRHWGFSGLPKAPQLWRSFSFSPRLSSVQSVVSWTHHGRGRGCIQNPNSFGLLKSHSQPQRPNLCPPAGSDPQWKLLSSCVLKRVPNVVFWFSAAR